MQNEDKTILPFSRRDVVIRALDCMDVRVLGTACVSSQTEYGPIQLAIGAHASDAQLQRAATRYNLPLSDLVHFREVQNLLLSERMPKH